MNAPRPTPFPDAARAFAFSLAPENRRRLLVGGLLNAVPVVGACWASGYALEVARRLGRGEEALPEWRAWGRLFVEGAAYYVIPTVYLFPALALYAVGVGLVVAVLLGRWLGTPVAPDTRLLVGLAIVGTALAILGAYPIPAALQACAERRRLGAAFALRALLARIRPRARAYHTAYAWAAAAFLAAVAWQCTLIACLVGPLGAPVLGFYLQLAWAHLFAQVFREAGSPFPPREGQGEGAPG